MGYEEEEEEEGGDGDGGDPRGAYGGAGAWWDAGKWEAGELAGACKL